MIELNRFKVCRCPKCGKISLTEAVKRFTCVYCRATRVWTDKRRGGLNVLVLKSFNCRHRAMEFVKVAKDAYEGGGVLKKAGYYNY